MPKKKFYLQTISPLGPKIHLTKAYWEYIWKRKHPEVRSQKQKALETLRNPAIIKHLNAEGFVITAYITKKLAKGEIVWQKPER